MPLRPLQQTQISRTVFRCMRLCYISPRVRRSLVIIPFACTFSLASPPTSHYDNHLDVDEEEVLGRFMNAVRVNPLEHTCAAMRRRPTARSQPGAPISALSTQWKHLPFFCTTQRAISPRPPHSPPRPRRAGPQGAPAAPAGIAGQARDGAAPRGRPAARWRCCRSS